MEHAAAAPSVRDGLLAKDLFGVQRTFCKNQDLHRENVLILQQVQTV